jgi:peroxiredoxin
LDQLPANHRILVLEGIAEFRAEPFLASKVTGAGPAKNRSPEELPAACATWLITPVAAPDFSLTDLAGQARTLSTLRGRNVLLSFVSTDSQTWRDDLKTTDHAARLCSKLALEALAINFSDTQEPDRVIDSLRQLHLAIPILRGTNEVAGVYTILYRYLFDRHRDMALPISFLIDEQSNIVRVFQGPFNPNEIERDCRQIPRTPTERLAKALPFPGVTDSFDFARNYLSFGSAYFQRGYFEHAEASFQHALRENPNSAEAEYGIGSVISGHAARCVEQSRFDFSARWRGAGGDRVLPKSARTQPGPHGGARESGKCVPAAAEMGGRAHDLRTRDCRGAGGS